MARRHCQDNNSAGVLTTSAIAPAVKANKNMGRVVAVCTRATVNGSVDKEVINQAAPTSCILEPVVDNRLAIHRILKSLDLKGDQGLIFVSNINNSYDINYFR